VRTVLVARDGQPFWDDLERLLARVNARIVCCTGDEIIEAAGEAGAGLVILGGETHRMAGAFLGCARVVVRADGAGVRIDEGARPPLAHAGWPVPEEAFLELTARMLRVAERRTFRVLLRILRPRTQETVMGQSEDFSVTGMALRTASRLERGEPLVIALHLPGHELPVRLLAEVTREWAHPADGAPMVGARFVGLDEPTRLLLRDFVWGGAEPPATGPR
jgi:hypothetical protein